MNRRRFITATAALALFPAVGFAGSDNFVDYKPGLIKQALAEGKTVFVDYSATWCSTCKAQERVMAKLMAKNPAYAEAMLFVRVDWDTYKRHEVTTSRRVPRRSVLLVLRGDEELGRIVAKTGTADIKALMDIGLAAA